MIYKKMVKGQTVYVNTSGRGSSSSAGLLILLILLAILGGLAYYVYKKPCDLKKHAPKIHKWVFEDSNVDWPKDPQPCTSSPS